ncbi:putative mitochondrial export translocase Oxa2 [Aspergillus coremiiformis]|uniref:Putative mitochondrial export translocase Oxa2 n=1 Tax=Aspergillus coremiiformis TaxID=138285 RepID=A0A5N6Z1B7_9EURO|nr:putative mitochondrial export translocase Oxa2 [Aspergillus coremiiformis]
MRPFHRSLRMPRKTTIQQIRHFHPTRPSPFISEVLDASSAFIQGVHSVSGLPWVISIPLTALIVRTTVAMPLQIYTKIQARKERDLLPLLFSWKAHHRKEMMEKKFGLASTSASFPEEDTLPLLKTMRNRKAILNKRWGIPRFWKPVNLLQLPIWISVMESLRAMSGNDRGLIPYFLSLVEPSTSDGATPLHLAVEPSLATEGAFWFPDLLAGDPTGILPAALTVSILLNLHIGWKPKLLRDTAELPKVQLYRSLIVRGVRTIVQLFALNIGVMSFFSEMPTALLLYWISSTNIATFQTFLLDKLMFRRTPLPPWKDLEILHIPRISSVSK